MKIPEYISKKKSGMIHCSAWVNRELKVISGDEYFYNFIGEIHDIDLKEYVHKDCLDEFLEACGAVPYYATSAGRDSATGLYNKRVCQEYVADVLAGNMEKHYLAIIDIDNFKGINDTYGHLFGDVVIENIATSLNSELRGRGIVGRFGGDEFFSFTSQISNIGRMESLLTCIQQRVEGLFTDRENLIKVTLSIGVSEYPENGQKYEELFEKADRALYVAKEQGKNQYVIYSDNLNVNEICEVYSCG